MDKSEIYEKAFSIIQNYRLDAITKMNAELKK